MRFLFGLIFFAPISTQIAPLRVYRTDQSFLFRTRPAFDLFFASDGILYIFKYFDIYDPKSLIFARKCGIVRPQMLIFAVVDAVIPVYNALRELLMNIYT